MLDFFSCVVNGLNQSDSVMDVFVAMCRVQQFLMFQCPNIQTVKDVKTECTLSRCLHLLRPRFFSAACLKLLAKVLKHFSRKLHSVGFCILSWCFFFDDTATS